MPVLLALGASLGWGVADFLGGLKSRQLNVLQVVLVSQLASLAVLGAILLVARTGLIPARSALFAALSGGVQTAGIGAYYRALSLGSMGVVAPISATAAVVPVVVGIASGDHLATNEQIGIGLALSGVVLTSMDPTRPDGSHRQLSLGVGMALLAALGIGFFLVLIDAATAQGGVLGVVLVNRFVSVVLLGTAAVLFRSGIPTDGRDLAAVTMVGLLSLGATMMFAGATTSGYISVVGAVAALYPVTTVVLARFVLKERVRPLQRVGALTALCGVALTVIR